MLMYCTAASDCGPRIRMSPMWLTSKMPTPVRTAMCSAISPEYSTGMSHPPKSTILAPSLRWTLFRAVFLNGAGGTCVCEDVGWDEDKGSSLISDLDSRQLEVSPSKAQLCTL